MSNDDLHQHERPVTASLERQQWLEQVVEALRGKFAGVGYTVPRNIRVSIGWPKRAATCGSIGECWYPTASSDKHHELFISPELTDGVRISDVLAHEMVHGTVRSGAGHGKAFKRCALAIGLQGRMRATTASPEFVEWAKALFKRIGDYPAGFITDTPKQGTRMIKCECPTCGYSCGSPGSGSMRLGRRFVRPMRSCWPSNFPNRRRSMADRKARALMKRRYRRRMPNLSTSTTLSPSVVGLLPAAPGMRVQRLDRDGAVIDESAVVGFVMMRCLHHTERAELYVRPVTGRGVLRQPYALIEPGRGGRLEPTLNGRENGYPY
jgi:hypothetical protein